MPRDPYMFQHKTLMVVNLFFYDCRHINLQLSLQGKRWKDVTWTRSSLDRTWSWITPLCWRRDGGISLWQGNRKLKRNKVMSLARPHPTKNMFECVSMSRTGSEFRRLVSEHGSSLQTAVIRLFHNQLIAVQTWRENIFECTCAKIHLSHSLSAKTVHLLSHFLKLHIVSWSSCSVCALSSQNTLITFIKTLRLRVC